MHVVQIAPPFFPIPPARYGGIERVIFDLTEGLMAAGHRVTLCAPGDSRTSAELVPTTPASVGLDMPEEEKARWFNETSSRAYAEAVARGADVVHDHTDYRSGAGYPLPVVRTIHGPAVDSFVRHYVEISRDRDTLVAISSRQRELFDEAATTLCGPDARLNFGGTIHNPVDTAHTPFYPRAAKGDYVAFLGRCHWEKDPAAAIRIALAAGVPLKMALRVTSAEREYYEHCVAPLLAAAGSQVELVGEVGGADKDELIGRAAAVIFSSPWEEPFGLVLAEAAARGTPVVAYRRGAAPELVMDGVTGILCDDEAAMARALPRAMTLDPGACRAHAEARFSRETITRQHFALYASVIGTDRRSRQRVNGVVVRRPVARRSHTQHLLPETSPIMPQTPGQV
jgi:glycosyltransferase involved in cell wall biosynthesis